MITSKPSFSSLEEHLTALYHCLLKSVCVVGICFIISWFFSEQILKILRFPIQSFLKPTQGALIFISPLEAFLAHLHVSFLTAILVSSPFWMGWLWKFIAPGLYKKERKLFLIFWTLGLVLFLLGVIFAYFIVLPLAFKTLLNFYTTQDQPFITLKNYLSFFIRSVFIFGIIFETPLLLMALCYSNILSVQILKKYRKSAIVLLALVSALITPPDIISQICVLIPLVSLYECSIYFISITLRKKSFKKIEVE